MIERREEKKKYTKERRMNGVKQEHMDIKDEVNSSPSHGKFDFRKLYGDLSRKLLNTPMEEIFSGVITDTKGKKAKQENVTGSTSPSFVHPAFPMYGATPTSPLTSPLSLPGNHCEQGATLGGPLALYSYYTNPMFSIPTSDSYIPNTNGSPVNVPAADSEPKEQTETYDDMENVDIQKLVDEFRVTLERYGVSQRFAARFIMQDTSQGNLSFLMEKGRNKKWADLSARGRLPYIKMKAWLESKEQQMMTLDMMKFSQEVRKSSPREPFNRRERFSMFQLNVLCRMFEENPNPPMHIRTSVAERLGIPLDRVNVWFQNQRARGFPARKNLQLQTMYETGGDSSKSMDMEYDYSQFRASLNSPNGTPPLSMTSPRVATTSPVFPTSEAFPKTPSPNQFSPPVSFSNVSETTDAPLDLSVVNGTSAKNRHSSGQVNKTPDDIVVSASNNTVKVSPSISMVNMEKNPRVGAAKRKRGCIPQQIIQRKDSPEPKVTETPSTKRVKTESTSEIEYNYLLHADDVHPNNVTESGKSSPSITDDNSARENTSTSSRTSASNSPTNCSDGRSVCESRDTSTMLTNDKSSNQSALDTNKQIENNDTKSSSDEMKQANTVDVLKVLYASFATKKDSSPISNVQEPDLD